MLPKILNVWPVGAPVLVLHMVLCLNEATCVDLQMATLSCIGSVKWT